MGFMVMMSTTSRTRGDKFCRMAVKSISVCGMSSNTWDSFTRCPFLWIWSTIFSTLSKMTVDAHAIACISFHPPFAWKRGLSIRLKNLQIKPTLQRDITRVTKVNICNPFRRGEGWEWKGRGRVVSISSRTSSRKRPWRRYQWSRMFENLPSTFPIEPDRSPRPLGGPRYRCNDKSRLSSRWSRSNWTNPCSCNESPPCSWSSSCLIPSRLARTPRCDRRAPSTPSDSSLSENSTNWVGASRCSSSSWNCRIPKFSKPAAKKKEEEENSRSTSKM